MIKWVERVSTLNLFGVSKSIIYGQKALNMSELLKGFLELGMPMDTLCIHVNSPLSDKIATFTLVTTVVSTTLAPRE